MKNKSYRIIGQVYDAITKAGLPNLQVEAWDKDLLIDDLLGNAKTDQNGKFSIGFDEAFYKEICIDRKPDIYFKVFYDGKLIKSTKDSVLWNVKQGEVIINIPVSFEVPGLVNGNSVFTVKGTVRKTGGSIKKYQQLQAYDLDLHGVGVYREVSKVSDIEDKNGFEYLGGTASDIKGRYEFKFYDWPTAKNRINTSLVVFAIQGEDIVGISPLVNPEDYYDEGLVKNLNISIHTTEKRTEFEVIETAVGALLKENNIDLNEIVKSRDQLNFVAGALDLNKTDVNIFSNAHILSREIATKQAHVFLYGIGKQGTELTWEGLHKRTEDELRNAIGNSVQAKFIRKPDEKELSDFIDKLQDRAARKILDDSQTDDPNTLNAMLSNALPKVEQRVAFLRARSSFTGKNQADFWDKYLPAQPVFMQEPGLVSALRWTHQLTSLSGNHQALVHELQMTAKIQSAEALLKLEEDEWKRIINKTGTPDSIEGLDAAEKAGKYREMLQSRLFSTFPSLSIAQLLKIDSLSIPTVNVANGVRGFLSQNDEFLLATSRIHDFYDEIKKAAGNDFTEVRSELMKLQRVYQVSTSSDTLRVLLGAGLHSAHAIASIPIERFIKNYSDALGGETNTTKTHQKAMLISSRNKLSVFRLKDYVTGDAALFAYGNQQRDDVKATIEKHIPNYSELFGSPDICECGHCRSVFSPSAYLVDLLRFLSRGKQNGEQQSPLDVLSVRRPDLVHLKLTCENANTLIPYIDLSNEVMEHYTAAGTLGSFEGHDTNKVTAEELRASPQNFELEAYRKLKDAKFPFNLPYHQPLDVIRTYMEHLGVKRYELMKAISPYPTICVAPSAAESLGMSFEEYQIITDNETDPVQLKAQLLDYYGYDKDGDLEDLCDVPEFLRRSGVVYTDLIELVKTRLINPHQDALENNGDSLYDQVITLYEPDSHCDLQNTKLRTIQSIIKARKNPQATVPSGIEDTTWSKFHRFIRLWRRLGWTIHETDLMLSALGEEDITNGTIQKLEHVVALREATQMSIEQLAVFWGNIDTYGEQTLYKKLFVNSAAQEVDLAFKADAQGRYLQNDTRAIVAHKSTILAAFGISEEDLSVILSIAQVKDANGSRLLDINTDALTLPNMSTLYRYVLLARTLRINLTDLCKLMPLCGVTPFSIWEILPEEFVDIKPDSTWQFYTWALSTRKAGFSTSLLDYILTGSSPASSRLGLEPENILQTMHSIHDAFATIEQEYPITPQSPLTVDVIAAMLGVAFPTDIVSDFVSILLDTKPFEIQTEVDLDMLIPDKLVNKYAYFKDSGRFTTMGVMSDVERDELKGLNVSVNFNKAVNDLYEAPEMFLQTQLPDIVNDMATVQNKLLNHPKQSTTPDLDEKLTYVYDQLLPSLKSSLRREAITQQMAALLDLDQETTTTLIAADVDVIANSLAAGGVTTVDKFVGWASLLHRAAKFIKGFDLSVTEVAHLIEFPADFDDIDFQALTESSWCRIRDYTDLRNAIPQAHALLTDLFSLANATDPADTGEALRHSLHLATAWNETDLKYLVDNYFQLGVADFKNEIALVQLQKIIRIVAKTGLSAETIVSLGTNETDFDALHATAQLLRNTVRSKYQNEDWIEVVGSLNGKLRTNQQNALVSYLLTQQDVRTADVKNADGLFEYLLIDVQMDPCMNTSRIVQANAAVQMFVQRILLNLESKISNDLEIGVAPNAIVTERCEWMKNYRVWEANRKVFINPENWLEPEWRDDRSEFFKKLESELVQNDITERSVEKALRGYLSSLNEVANLEVCGMWRENTDSDKGSGFKLHVFARTNNTPYKYFYRIWNEYQKWSAWETVPVDIRSVENGDKNGVHLLPVVWKARLFLFWPEFMEKVEQSKNSAKFVGDLEKEPISSLEPERHWEVRLAWSEYVDGTWTPKLISKEFVPTGYRRVYTTFYNLEGLKFHFAILDELASLSFSIVSDGHLSFELLFDTPDGKVAEGVFNLKDVNSKINAVDFYELEANSYDPHPTPIGWGTRSRRYDSVFMNLLSRSSYSDLQFDGRSYLAAAQAYKLLFTPAPVYERFERNYRSQLSDTTPFFFANTSETYFVKPEKSYADLELKQGRWVANTTHHQLAFHTFHHPYSNEYVSKLNRGGLEALMEADTGISSDDGKNFKKYAPNFPAGLVVEVSEPSNRTYYQENICFDPYGANSLYNWELFFHVPLYIATRLSRNGKYAEAMKWFHYMFDPTTNEAPVGDDNSRYWKVLPFKGELGESIEEFLRALGPSSDTEEPKIGEWRDNPFNPHLVASNFRLTYMKHVVMKYIDNLIAWGDSLLRQFTRESVSEALQIYVLASHILGPKPEFVPRRGSIEAESYYSLEGKWDDFSNAWIEFENLFPHSSNATSVTSSQDQSLLGIGNALYFCIPANKKLLDYWGTVEDRLYKIRHCQDIDGVGRELALFSPPIDPALLIQATSQGLDLGSILSGLGSPPPNYRFSYLLQKTNEFCGEVKQLGSSLLAALEKRDAESLSRLRASHETTMLELITAVRERRILDAKVNKERLVQSRDAAKFRLQHYLDLLGESVEVPSSPTLSAVLTENTRLPANTQIQTLRTNVDTLLVESGEAGVKLIPKEKEDLDRRNAAKDIMSDVATAEAIAGVLIAFPEISIFEAPIGVGAGQTAGGGAMGAAASAIARVKSTESTLRSQEAAFAATTATYIRREQDWTLQANMAAQEIVQIDKQITTAEIQVQVAEKEFEQHKQSIKQAKEIALFLEDKFTNLELYQWMKEQLFSIYKQSYNMAFDLAKKTEAAYKYELGLEKASFIQYGYWADSVQGLVAGEKLQLALRQLEKSYLEENRRELELRRSVSLALLDPLALIELRETGKCEMALPEELFDLDFQGHYYRRIKSVSLSIPCVAGPYTSISCSLRLLNSSVRVKTTMMNIENKYERLELDDDRFRTSYVPVTSIATSTGQNDSGMFELNFRDERYLPFEGAGAISRWQIQLTEDQELRQFDYSTITDVVLHMSYTARESAGTFKRDVVAYLKHFAEGADELTDQPFLNMLSIRHEFPTEWHRFLYPGAVGEDQALKVTIGKERFPFFAQERDIVVGKIEVLAKCNPPTPGDYDYCLLVSYSPRVGALVESPETAMPNPDLDRYGDLYRATIEIPLGLQEEERNVDEELNVAEEMCFKLRHASSTVAGSPPGTPAPDYTKLTINPLEVEELYLVLHYKLC